MRIERDSTGKGLWVGVPLRQPTTRDTTLDARRDLRSDAFYRWQVRAARGDVAGEPSPWLHFGCGPG